MRSRSSSGGNQADPGATPAVELRDLVKEFDFSRGEAKVRAVDGIDLSIEEGEFFALLGPSGCGKTTTLRMIAGFEEPNSGEVLLRGNSVRGVPAFHRPVNTVFQDFALFPHMSVLQNVMFGLKMAGARADEARHKAEEALELVRLPHVGNRKPAALSGGQRQRVAVARALVNRPAVLLLDEPLGALDLKLRKTMQFELKTLQQQVGITFVYVTHDQEEALTMADRIAVMSEGKVLQIGAPDDIYERPTSRFVADFIGETNFLDGVLVERGAGDGAGGPAGLGTLRLAGGTTVVGVLRDPDMAVGTSAALAIRPEKLDLERGAEHVRGEMMRGDSPLGESRPGANSRGADETTAVPGETRLPGVISGAHYLGTDARYVVSSAGAEVVARIQNQHHGFSGMLPVGSEVSLVWRTENGSILE